MLAKKLNKTYSSIFKQARRVFITKNCLVFINNQRCFFRQNKRPALFYSLLCVVGMYFTLAFT